MAVLSETKRPVLKKIVGEQMNEISSNTCALLLMAAFVDPVFSFVTSSVLVIFKFFKNVSVFMHSCIDGLLVVMRCYSVHSFMG